MQAKHDLRYLDLLLCAIMIIPMALTIMIFALLIKLTTNHSAFFIQKRIGLNGAIINVVKLRTMYEQEKTNCLGRFLRRFGLDELPQACWNIPRGEMSFFGPRPLPLEEAGANIVSGRTCRRSGIINIFSAIAGPAKGHQPTELHYYFEDFELQHWSKLWIAKLILALIHSLLWRKNMAARLRFFGFDQQLLELLKETTNRTPGDNHGISSMPILP